jgi:hypothetical protein
MRETIDEPKDFLREPTFLPRITRSDGHAVEEALASNLFDSGVRLKAAVIDATYAATDPPLLKRLRDERLPCLMEIHTQRFITGRFLDIDSLAGLPYAPDEPISATNFNKEQASALAVGALRFQQDHRCDHYISAALPYRDQDLNQWAVYNDWLLEEACRANGGPEIDRRPLIAQVPPGRKTLMDPQRVVSRLLDYPIAGAYVQPLLLDPTKDGPEKLKQYVEFLQAIRDGGIPVLASRVGAFGLVLQALGIPAFDSGLGQAEATNLAQLNRTPTEKELERKQEGRGGGPDRRIYFEVLKTTLTAGHAAAILSQRGLRSSFVCEHGCCKYRGFEDLPERRRQHFLWTREAEVESIQTLPTPRLRRDFVREQLRNAQEIARRTRRTLISLGVEAPRFDHLDRWVTLLGQEQLLPAFAT